MLRLSALAFFVSLLLSSCVGHAQAPVLEPAAFRQRIVDSSAQLLDVRTREEYSEDGHIHNAILADWNSREEFETQVAKLDKNKPVLIYCHSGRRSASAAEEMQKLGFTQVYNLKGGIVAWKGAGLPVE